MTSDKTAAKRSTTTAPKTGHVAVNGVDYYYEIHGQGEPLVLHGGLMSIDGFRPLLPSTADRGDFVSICRATGARRSGDRPITLVDSANDVDVVLDDRRAADRHLHYEVLFAPLLVPTIRPFLDGKTGPKTDHALIEPGIRCAQNGYLSRCLPG